MNLDVLIDNELQETLTGVQTVEPENLATETAVKTEQPEEPIANQLRWGIVVNCLKLNVRKYPKIGAPCLCIIDAFSEVVIDDEKSTEEFYKIWTPFGVEGFCSKKYIVDKQ